MRRLNLGGSWRFSRVGEQSSRPGTVPGSLHADLLALGAIIDPFHGENERTLQWIGEADWCYRRSFRVGASLLDCERVLLRCHGLDTLASIRINGRRVARTDNMHRRYEFDVKRNLRRGSNRIEITFASATRAVRRRQSDDGSRSDNLVTFVRPKQLALREPEIDCRADAAADGRFEIRLRARRPALWTWIDVEGCDPQLSDNSFHLRPGRSVTLTLRPDLPLRLGQLRQRLRVYSLIDTFRERPPT